MNNYLFILGNHPKLAIDEIKSVFYYLGIDAFIKSLSSNTLLVNSNIPLDSKLLIKRLGGTIKIAKIIKTSDKLFDGNDIYRQLSKDKKINLGISFYNCYMSKFQVLNTLKKIKKQAKQINTKIRYVLAEKNILSNSQVYNKLTNNKGLEFIIFKYNQKYFLAQTQVIFDIDKYSMIDYSIPKSDAKKGMLPPKLANIMLNLSLNKDAKKPIIYDPFCGSGRILLQGILMNHEMIGSDIDKKSVDNSQANIEWLIGKYNIKNAKYYLFLQDATTKINLDKKITNLVTEPDLGEAYKIMPNKNEINNNFNKLSKKYIASFKNITNILTDNTKVVIVFPEINNISLLDMVIDKFKMMGYHKISEFIYAREYQIVRRHIGVFVYKKCN